MNKKAQKQLAKLQEDAGFQFLYGEYKKTVDILRPYNWEERKNVFRISISDYVKRKYTTGVLFKRYEYRAIWKYFGKESFAVEYHEYMSTQKETMN